MKESSEEKIIVEMMLGMVYNKAKDLYSKKLIDHGMDTTHFGIMEHPDGYAKETGT